MTMRIYVGNLPFSSNDQELRSLFEAHGSVSSAQIMVDRETGRSRGFGFVEMDDASAGNAAIGALNGYNLGGRQLVVNEARPREERSGGGGGGRGRGGFGGGGGGGGYGGGGGRRW
ncbi:MAG: RNA-binding protein [Phycisphaerae bacterium]|nr:RNA-binding protein [Phycisphaerae bacterium]